MAATELVTIMLVAPLACKRRVNPLPDKRRPRWIKQTLVETGNLHMSTISPLQFIHDRPL